MQIHSALPHFSRPSTLHAAMGAAALSAAVTSTQQQETTPTSQAEPSKKKGAPQTPAALREGARVRGKTAIAASGG